MQHVPHAEPAWEGIAVPPKGVMLDTPERIVQHAREIQLQAVLTHAMPPGNITEITPEERQGAGGVARRRRQDRIAEQP